MSNVQAVRDLLRECWRLGVREIIICAGARNAAFVAQLAEPHPFAVWSFFEERSAAFFALGKIQAHHRPVAVITTSGTAAAELLPAAVEADHQGLPLLLITADRPRSYRGSGAPQTINQIGLFSHFVAYSLDWAVGEKLTLPPLVQRPMHWNICFDEPLLDEPLQPLQLAEVPEVARSFPPVREVRPKLKEPLIIVGGLADFERQRVARILKTWRRPLYLEAPSGLRGHPDLEPYTILAGEKTLSRLRYDGVIRIGSVPTVRLWRDLESSQLPVVHYSRLPFSGLPRQREVYGVEALPENPEFTPWSESEFLADRQLRLAREELFRHYVQSEPAWFAWLSRALPEKARIFVGNSLPIREWDFAAVHSPRHEVYANRGANGIDGLISTFLGQASNEISNWCVLGDLSALYDLSGLWPARDGRLQKLNLVIINNGGGKIFQRMFRQPLFENGHGLNFKAWAEMWGWDYLCLTEPGVLPPATRPRILEIVPSNDESEKFWQEWEAR